jgi:SagB-type dehydrogenase family enzyme
VKARARTAFYRRSPHLVSYWRRGRLVFHNFATGSRVAGTALTIGLLDYFDTWRNADTLLAHSRLPAAQARRAIRRLVAATLLEQSTRVRPVERAMDAWSDWNPAAGFFHFSTKDVRYTIDDAATDAFLAERVSGRTIPAPVKRYPRHATVALPAARARDRLARVLLARRTWRQFGRRPVSLDDLSSLLHLTFGAQAFVDLGAAGKAMLRTSPSAGALNPIEAYVLVRRVAALAPGIYHYAPVEHRLTRLRRGMSEGTIARYLGGQLWYGKAAIVVLMTAVFPRTRWKYPYARAYRSVLLEAGHFCQTFCLAATALALAPFCTAALADSRIERDLGIDGVDESVIYACGAGTRPPGVDWAPSPKGAAPLRRV